MQEQTAEIQRNNLSTGTQLANDQKLRLSMGLWDCGNKKGARVKGWKEDGGNPSER